MCPTNHGELWSANELLNYLKTGKKEGVAPKKSKYGNVKSVADGKTFDSTKEKNRYLELKQMEARGEISELHEQVTFKFAHNDIKICSYIADFTYNKNGKEVVEDVKSEMTRKLPAYRIKCKLMKAFYNIDIKEI